jgi:hypothetical protein
VRNARSSACDLVVAPRKVLPHAVPLVRVIAIVCLVLGITSTTAWSDDDARITTGYRKGRPIRVALVEIDWSYVEVKTARAYRAMQRAAAEDGIELLIRSGFRSHEHQTWLYQAWRAGWGNRAARPGHSNHQSGSALDLVVHDPAVRAWLDRHARRFGFRRTVKKEPWHWEFSPPRRRVLARH